MQDVTAIGNRSSSIGGFALAGSPETFMVLDSEFSFNRAVDYGGAFHVSSDNDYGLMTLQGNLFEQNAVEGYGGAVSVYLVEALTSTRDQFVGNTADRGGAIYLFSDWATIDGDSAGFAGFRRNVAEFEGGAIYAVAGPLVTDTVDFGQGAEDNLAAGVSGDLYISGQSITGLGQDESFTCNWFGVCSTP
jgi:predicted outer membrane repeat protein